MAEDWRVHRHGLWKGNEITAVKAFFVLFAASSVVSVAHDLYQTWGLDPSFFQAVLGVATDLVVSFAIASFVMGIYYVHLFREEGIVPLGVVVRTVLQVAVVVALFFTLLLAMDALWGIETRMYDQDDLGRPELTPGRSIVLLVSFFLLTFVGTALAQLAVLVAGFGMMGTLYMMEVGMTPKFLIDIQDVTAREGLEDRVWMWLFNIHGAMDTRSVLVDEPSRETEFPWRRFRTAVTWQVLFGLIVAIYISLNPWLIVDFELSLLFRFVSAAVVLVPLLVLPWFIHVRLGSRIKGAHKDFYLYAAMRQRITRLMIAAGTILIFLRLAIDRHPIEEILHQFRDFTFLLVLLMVAFSFIYFNFIENRLAIEVFRRWSEASGRTGSTDDVEGGQASPGVTGSE